MGSRYPRCRKEETMAERTPEEERTMANYIDREAMLEQIARRESLMVGDKMISIDALGSLL